LASAAVAGTVSGGGLGEAAIVLGGVAPIPWRLGRTEAALKGKKLSEAVVKEALRADLQVAKPLEENGYKLPLIEAAVSRALMSLLGGK